MSDFLKDLRNLPPEKPKVHTVCIEGKKVVVTLKKKLEERAEEKKSTKDKS